MTQAPRRVSLELANDVMWREHWWRLHGDVDAIREHPDVRQVNLQFLRPFAKQLLKAFRSSADQTGL
jgi:hypothetical protein